MTYLKTWVSLTSISDPTFYLKKEVADKYVWYQIEYLIRTEAIGF